MNKLCETEFVFKGETYVVRALSEGIECIVQVFKNTQKINKLDYSGALDLKNKLMKLAESDVINDNPNIVV